MNESEEERMKDERMERALRRLARKDINRSPEQVRAIAADALRKQGEQR